MVERKVREAINTIKEFLKNHEIKSEKIIIFGSRANGIHRKDSDVDIAIISRHFDKKDIFQKAEMLKGLNWMLVEKFGLAFDIVPISLKEWQGGSSLLVDFVREGITAG